ncbi:uncharacterized protein LOC122510717 [Leptopilina heterotoma]|uniref:uncharacterized protein LOC122510717 n=1 Tax=Leptopilina heterotoma TaxID=63436 RepID=UPI001CA96C22|nr:uncharacterized protein LOC122510717 [Leptopilina heterotoma]
MLSLFRKLITNSNESSSQVPFVDETFTNKLEIFIFNLSTKEWSESVSGTIYIEKQQPPKTSLMIIKIDSLPYHLIRKITRDFQLFEKDDRTWMFRVYEKTKATDYNESTIIACRFSTKTAANAFNNFITNLQTLERAGFENLNFRLEIIRKKHEEEIAEKECALTCNFPLWSDLLNGEYYQNFHNKNTDKDTFRCMAEIREFDPIGKKWKKLILGIVKIDVIEDTGQSVLTVIENEENFVRLGITRDDFELIALDNRTWMWRGYKKSQNIQSLLIGCRFINSKITKNFGITIIKAQEYAPLRCKFRDEYMKETFHKEYQLKLTENQIALECNFPGEYELTDNDPGDLSFPSTSQILTKKNNKLDEIKNSPKSITSSNENSNLQIILDNRVNFYKFDSKLKKWNNPDEGELQIVRNGEIGNISIVMKIKEGEFVCQLSRDLELMKKDSRSLMWRVTNKEKFSIFFLITEFESCEKLECFEKWINDVKGHYSSELECDQLVLETLKNIFESDLEELSQALGVDFPSHVDLAWLSGSNVVKYRAKNISETDFIKGSVFNSKVDIYKFDSNLNEWKKLTALPGSVVVKVKQFQEFQKTILYAISDEFQGTIVVKCEIAGNLNLEMKDKSSCIWRGYVEMDDNDNKIESLLIACRFTNFHTANHFKSVVADVVQKPLKCYLRHDYLSAILKKRREEILRENQIPLDLPVEN